jgi:hypothetical protein
LISLTKEGEKRPKLIKLEVKNEIPTKIQRIVREYLENLFSNKMKISDELGKFLDILDAPKLNQEDMGVKKIRSITNDVGTTGYIHVDD